MLANGRGRLKPDAREQQSYFSNCFESHLKCLTGLAALAFVSARYVDSFRENQVGGRALRDLTNDDLRDELDVKAFGPRKAQHHGVAFTDCLRADL